MAELMVGGSLHTPERTPGAQPGEVLVQIKDMSLPSPSHFGTSLRDIALEVRAGEVMGIGGVAGNGQDSLWHVLPQYRLGGFNGGRDFRKSESRIEGIMAAHRPETQLPE
jgi:ABC-type uncharacterized transport system ATPase subunit